MKDISLIFLLCYALSLNAQEQIEKLSTGKIKKFALEAEKQGDFETTSIYLKAYLEKRPEDLVLKYKLANNYRMIGDYQSALAEYRVVKKDQKKARKFPLIDFYIAEILVINGDCKSAVPIYNQFRKDYKNQKEEKKYRRLAKAGMEGCALSANDSLSKHKFLIEAINGQINSNHIEGAPVHLKDNQWLYNSLKSKQTVFKSTDSIPKRYFYKMENKEGEFADLGKWEILAEFGEGEIANGAFNKNKNRFYFSSCNANSQGKMSCDIYKMEKNRNSWSKPNPLPNTVNTKHTETQVTVGIDERGRETIYFVSDRNEGKGGLDIWYSTYLEEKNTYKKAKNCGSKVNTVGDEMTPFIHPLNNKLFFSSNGHPGYGQLDVYRSAGQRSKWQEPSNLGKWINSAADELYYTVHPNGSEGAFASNRQKDQQNKFCCDDLYFFKELNKIQVRAKGFVSGEGKVLPGAQISVYQLDENGEKLFLQSSIAVDPEGNYELILEPNQIYYIQAKKEGFLVEEKVLRTKNSPKSETYQLDFNLSIISDRAFILENIYYAFDKDIVTKESEITIDTTIYEILILNPEVIVEIGSHTDNKGSDAYNQKLSQKRAESVIRYLLKKGIARERIVAKGYGEEVPIAPNQHENGSDNPEGRAKNRRTEFKVIGEIKLIDNEDD